MNGIHPNLGLAFVVALSALLAGVGGCSHNQMAMTNPFLAPDRVPPPATRILPPGTAQPYYPGDPLPVMQSAAPAAIAPIASAAAAVAEPKKIAFSNEPTVTIPSDDNSLRFELPATPEPTPIADAQGSPIAPIANAQGSPSSGVVPAIYNAAPTGGQPVVNAAFTGAQFGPAASGPWRSPQIAAPAPPAAYVPQPIVSPFAAQPVVTPGYPVVAPMSVAAPSMDVRLRAVPSPPPEPVEPSTPRIRIPGYPAPQPMTGVGGAAQPAAYYAPVAVPIVGGMVQTVQLTPLGTMAAAPPTASSGNPDGFRPRSSMR